MDRLPTNTRTEDRPEVEPIEIREPDGAGTRDGLTGDGREVYLRRAMPWWLWMVLGFGLLVAEMVLPSDFFLFFFGLSALVVGGLLGFGLDGPAWLPWLLFAVLSVVAVLTLRRPLRDRFTSASGSNVGDRVVGEMARLLVDLAPGDVGQAELRGSVWRVRSRAQQTLLAGTHTRVERVEGLTLWVVADETMRGH